MAPQASMACHADLILVHGRVHTLAEPGTVEAIAISAGRITAIGRDEEIRSLASPRTRLLDLGGQTVLPGFVDAHTHLVSAGLIETAYLDLSEAGSLPELLEIVRAAVEERATGEWLIGRGWEESHWPEQRYVERQDLDRAVPDRPVALFRVDGHLLSVNSKALELVKLPEEFASLADLERGLLWEEAAWWFHEKIEPEQEELERAILAGAHLAHSLGITSVHDIVKPSYIKAYQKLRAAGHLKLRVYLNLGIEAIAPLFGVGLCTGFGDEWLRLGGAKVFTDGSLGAGTAALSEPYLDRPGRGKLNYRDEELFQLVRKAHEHGWQVLAHAIGDRAIEQVLRAYELAGVTASDRYRIEHLELASNEQLARAARLGLIASMQPNFLKWARPGDMYEARLGKERTSRIGPHRSALAAGLKLAFGSDCMPLGPLFGLHQAVNAPYPAQRLTVEEAIRCYTLGGAYASFEEGLKGSLEPGKLADLVVLSGDPFEQPSQVEEIKVEMTIVGGELVFARSGVDNRP